MSTKAKPVCQSGPTWLREVATNLWSRIGLKESNKRPFAALTGQDSKAYATFLHALELWGFAATMRNRGATHPPRVRLHSHHRMPHTHESVPAAFIVNTEAENQAHSQASLPPEFRDGTLQTAHQTKWRAWRTDREDGIEGTGDTEIEAVMALADQYRQIEEDMGEGANRS